MDSPLNAEQMTGVRDALFQGEKITAIKIYREATGSQLVDAKAAVEAIERELRQTTPESFRQKEGRGCLGVVGVCLGIAIWLMYGLSR
jgi:hypothetical protein